MAAHTREAVRKRQARMTDNRQKLAVAQRALQLNILAREIAAKIEAAGIAEIVDGTRANEGFDAISGARGRRRIALADSGV